MRRLNDSELELLATLPMAHEPPLGRTTTPADDLVLDSFLALGLIAETEMLVPCTSPPPELLLLYGGGTIFWDRVRRAVKTERGAKEVELQQLARKLGPR